MTDRIPVPTESQEQQALFQWARIIEPQLPAVGMLYHIPNEGKRSYAGGRRAIAEGLRKGVPDLCLPFPAGGYHGLYIELKRTKGGRLTPEQRDWIDALQQAGYQAQVCYGWRHAADVIEEYLGESG